MQSTHFRTEQDSMGEMLVPQSALYGASTQRAVLNFPISGYTMPQAFLQALGPIKWGAALANNQLGLLGKNRAQLIADAALDIYHGQWLEHFPVDVFQTGSATSSNMNANEVIASLANRHHPDKPIHPNDDVNLNQSSNDIMPSVLHISIALSLKQTLQPIIQELSLILGQKAQAWKKIMKIGRTHWMDATPLSMGNVMSGYQAQIEKALQRIDRSIHILTELAIGGTAVGTGINCHPHFAQHVCDHLSQKTGLTFYPAKNHFEAQAARDDCVEVAGHIITLTDSLIKIANDIRFLGSGPRCGLGELKLPATQPGSSIMPGKVNPVMSEMLVQASLYVQGLMYVVQQCGKEGHFELNATIPLIAHSMLDGIRILSPAIDTFTKRCLIGLEVDEERCRTAMANSLMLVTALNPYIGYDQAADVAKKAYTENKTLKAVIEEKKLMDLALFDQIMARVIQEGR